MNTISPRILVDCDGVLADFLSLSLAYINEKQGTSHRIQDLQDWEFFRSISTREVEEAFWTAIHETPGMVLSMGVYPGAQAGLQDLMIRGDVYIVTASHHSRHWAYERAEWLKKHFGIHPNRVVHTHQKHLCKGDVFIDDRPSAVEMWQEHHPEGIGILWDQPYNRSSSLFRAKSWESVVHVLEERKERA